MDEGANVNLSGENHRHMEKSLRRQNSETKEAHQEVLKQVHRHGITPLGAAALHNDTATATLLLDRGAEVNQSSGFNGQALGLAAMLGHADMVRLLLGRGADPKLKDTTGQTALGWAKQANKYPEIIELLTNWP